MTAKNTGSAIAFNVIGYSILSLVAILCLLPFVMLVSASFTSEPSILKHGYAIFPRSVSLDAYRILFKYPIDLLRAYGVSIFITGFGTLLGLLLISMVAFVISRKDFKYRNALSFYFYFVTLFNGGLVSTYILMIRYYHLKNSVWALILPNLINVFYLIIMRSFMSSIPSSLGESAKMDGAGDFSIFVRIILPLSTPAMAAIGLFLALDYWNDWYNSMLYITDYRMYPLQYMLYNMLSETEAMSRLSGQANISMQNMPMESMKMAMAVVAIGPVILLYPFIQRFFVKGMMVGAVKG